MKKRLTCTIKFKTDHQALSVCICFTKPTKTELMWCENARVRIFLQKQRGFSLLNIMSMNAQQ